MLFSLFLLLLGVLFAWTGGSLFVDGSVALARRARWPAAVVGATVAAFGTSAPELMVAIDASHRGMPQISLGDVLGSNVVNISLILAIAITVAGLQSNDKGATRDWMWAGMVPVLLAAVLADGWFSRADAAVLLSAFFVWLGYVIRHARRHAAATRDDAMPEEPIRTTAVAARILGGLAVLIIASHFVVTGGKGIAEVLGWSPFVVGAMVVAVATGTPELATVIVSTLRGQHDIGLGGILGSNVFNGLFIASVAALIHPFAVQLPEITPSIIFGVTTTLIIYPGRTGTIGKNRGILLLGLYVVYVIVSASHSGGH